MVEKTDPAPLQQRVTLIVDTVEADGFFYVELRYSERPDKVLASGVSRRENAAYAYALAEVSAKLLASPQP